MKLKACKIVKISNKTCISIKKRYTPRKSYRETYVERENILDVKKLLRKTKTFTMNYSQGQLIQ